VRVVGTAGHVDHGKSSLVRALTGTDPDRWEEERRRGMTLDLGFARLRFPDGLEAGIVDVPGHERFVHNMLAGATGMDVLLLVVAANEGPRAQTFEHLAIMSLLDVPAAIVVLTKCDLAGDDERRAVRDQLAQALRGTVAAGAPVIPVSTVTGEGLDALRAALQAALAALPPRAVEAPAYLPVDRAFTLPGRGTIVTGTLMQGTIAAGDVLALRPGDVEARARSLEVFGESKASVTAGSRVAINLAGVGLDEVARGSALVAPEIAAHERFAVRFTALPDAVALLRRRTPVRVHLGAGEGFGTLVFTQPPASAEEVDATLHLRRALAAVPGQRFVVRRMSPKTVLGGGTIAAAGGSADAESSPDVAALRAALAESGLAARTVDELAAAANVRSARAAEILAEETAAGRAWLLARPAAYVDAAAGEELLGRVGVALARHEAAAPWMLGITSIALAREVGIDEALLVRVLVVALADERLVVRSGYYASAAFVPHLTAEQERFFATWVPSDPAQPLVPAPLAPLVIELRRSPVAGVSTAFDALIATAQLIRVGEHLYRVEQLAEIRARLERTLRAEKRMTASRFRDVVGTSRKYIVPLLEYFDAQGVTVRDGDQRALRAVSGAASGSR
jgi:selenocysteine-specific elongation factor